MRIRNAAVLVIACLASGVTGRALGASAEVEAARARLRAARPEIRWHPVLQVDINCDGTQDQIFTGRDSEQFYVAAVISGPLPGKISICGFYLRGQSQDSFCGPPSLLEKESMDYDPTEAAGDVPEGFQRSPKCFGLHLVAGECDTFHLFWNHKTDQLDWWRL